jgi:predicted lipoprotein with Yx(FWY)xxD motif
MRGIMKVRFLPLLAVLVCSSSVLAQSPFPLPIPTRPTSFPLPIPTRPAMGGSVVAWGSSDVYGEGVPPAGLEDVVEVAAGGFTAVAVKADGSVAAWGAFSSDVPSGLSDVVQVDVASDVMYSPSGFGAALLGDGTVRAWGRGISNVPTGLSSVVSVRCGVSVDFATFQANGFGLALKSDGTVVGWGDSPNAIVPEGLSEVVAIDTGSASAVALRSDGTLIAWGSGSIVDMMPADLTDIVQVAIGSYDQTAVALKSDGSVVAWGEPYNNPSPPVGLSNVVQVSAGGGMLALLVDGALVQWGARLANPIPIGLTECFSIASADGSAYAVTMIPGAARLFRLRQLGIDLDELAADIAASVVAALPDNYGIATKADLGTAVSDATSQAIAQVQAAPNDYNLFSAAQYDENRTNGQTDVVSQPNTFGLFDSTQYEANRITGVAEGKAEVTGNPTAYSLFTESSIMDMNLGSLMLKKRADANALDLELTIETKDNFTTDGWQVAERITRLVSMEGVQRQFLRVRADAPYVAPDVKVLAHPTLGNILTDGAGRVLYYFAADTPGGNPLFSGSSWPYVTVPAAPKADAGVSAALASSTFGKPGGPYLTVNARPVYTYVGDSQAGQANGHGAGSVWWTIRADGVINQ